MADLKLATAAHKSPAAAFSGGQPSREALSGWRNQSINILETMAGAACSGMPWSLGLEGTGWGCVGCRRWPSQHT